MKKMFIFALALTCGVASAQLKIGGKSLNTGKLLNAASSAVSAYTLTDADVANLCMESIEWSDANNPVADPYSERAQRLARLTANLKEVNGTPLNFKVYEVADINAFASGDGSVRVFAGLMEVMDDNELMAIIGHEMGHVANGDVRDAMKQAYKIEAARNALGAVDGSNLAKLTDGQVGALTGAYLESKFSREQEFEADDYGMKVCMENGFSPYGMADSLDELVKLSGEGGQRASLTQKMFSSHPDSAVRAKRMREKADAVSGK